MLSPVFLRAISTLGCCRLQFFSIDILPPPITMTRLPPGEEKLINTRESWAELQSLAAERVRHSPSFTFYPDSSCSAGKDAEKNRKKWTKTLWLKHLKRGEINFLPRPVFSVRGLNMFSAIPMVTASRQDWVSKTNKTLCNWRPGLSLLLRPGRAGVWTDQVLQLTCCPGPGAWIWILARGVRTLGRDPNLRVKSSLDSFSLMFAAFLVTILTFTSKTRRKKKIGGHVGMLKQFQSRG